MTGRTCFFLLPFGEEGLFFGFLGGHVGLEFLQAELGGLVRLAFERWVGGWVGGLGANIEG